MAQSDQFNARQLVHTPAEMMTELVQWAEGIQRDPGITFGIDAIDKVVIPMRPGNLVCIIARPGHAKTSLLVYLARQEARRILERGTQNTEAVVYTTWEQTSEELTAMLMADVDIDFSDISWGRASLDAIKRKAIKGVKQPVWIIGHGISRAGLSIPRMTPDLVLAAIESMRKDFGITPTMMLFDYLQLIPTRVAKERVQQVTEMPIRLKELAMRIGAPAVAAVQASREVDGRTPPLPELNDAQWASSIEQTADKCFSLWRPIKTMEEDDEVEVSGTTYVVNETLLIVRLLKQRGDRGRYTWGMYFNPSLLKLAELETRHQSKDNGKWYNN
jgi:replicative DNA helicase